MPKAIDENKIHQLLEKAVKGNQPALESILKEVQDFIYKLSLRMLWNPVDAEDATQEILIRILQNLKTFKYESKFSTWVYRVTVNFLINQKKKTYALEENYKGMIRKLEKANSQIELEKKQDTEGLKLGCTYAMLLSLDRNYRIAFILHYVFELKGEEAAEILQISEVNYRKRVSRAKEKLLSFMTSRCNFINDSLTCKCPNVLTHLVSQNFITSQDTKKLKSTYGSKITDKEILRNYDSMERLAILYKENSNWRSSSILNRKLKKLVLAE
ncbi:MAG TPA: RNA polymerase sigma factor [Leptospiraceae bacterium]|nr:RNA polymerase sigma factor [Leptospiraceae bacterium]HMW07940.1 RNA polymerase sigma factor [Leptospiraceae bacterium]HMX35024.1 RNA polymerase sigma factor [Leptospiraceae bacterium]HMY34154.1 RNA polymerase sigma factor [Leptospiraceae bacterium]HMZ64719.1 RNA polymerase sigma factor [Leptospiraceae bacterium]